ncbi:hypothetical protein [Caulobacter soli]|uniref:hypothetical protein n=1 Tax=Caulobacter soli TaxID=2708539 RepID=UPI0013EE0B19|nr:hypothetical protein [Caulobacter soli]
MILMIVCAVLGACLGLYVKPRWLGVAVAVVLIVCVEGGDRLFIGLIEQQPNRELLIGRLEAIFGETWLDAVGPTAAALVGAVLAAIMGKVMDGERQVALVNADGIRRKVGKDGRYARLDGMIQERPVQTAAESRFDSILGL